MGINKVTTRRSRHSTLTAAQLTANSDTLANVQLWDPTQTPPTYTKLQATSPTTRSTRWPSTGTRSTAR